ncbi:acyl-CoA synthetase, partial [Streptomyces sp. NPDC058953]
AARVAGVADATWGPGVAAVVQVRDGAPPPTLDEIRTHCRGMIAGYKLPRRLVVAAENRRSPTGKADYRWARSVVSEAAPG